MVFIEILIWWVWIMDSDNDSNRKGEKETEVPVGKFLLVLAVFVILAGLLYFGRLLFGQLLR